MNEIHVSCFNDRLIEQAQSLKSAQTDNFIELVDAAKLRKDTDFIGADFSGMNLDGLHLSEFNFTGANFKDCSITGTVFENCDLDDASFKFPPIVKDKWGRKPQLFVGEIPDSVIELMSTARNAGKQEERRSALRQLLALDDNSQVREFVRHASLRDKSKKLRSWLKQQLLSQAKDPFDARSVLIKSLFQGREAGDTEEDIKTLLRLDPNTDHIIQSVCRACTVNQTAIAPTVKAIGDNVALFETLLSNLSYSRDYGIWTASARQLRKFSDPDNRKRSAFLDRLFQLVDSDEIENLAEAAAFNDIRIEALFELSEKGYVAQRSRFGGDGFILYCYFFSENKYENDVLYYSFKSKDFFMLSAAAFSAYCFVADRNLYDSILDADGYFYFDAQKLLNENDDSSDRGYDKYPDGALGRLRMLAKSAWRLASKVDTDQLVAKPDAVKNPKF